VLLLVRNAMLPMIQIVVLVFVIIAFDPRLVFVLRLVQSVLFPLRVILVWWLVLGLLEVQAG